MDDLGAWAKSHREGLMAKYGGSPSSKTRRSTGTNLLTNQGADSSFFGSIALGTPAVSFNVVLDTGSADLWVAGNTCTKGCSTVATFNPSGSSTYKNSSTPFQITYGSGSAAGALASDTVQMAGFSVASQVFAVCDVVNNVLTDPVSGLLGLGFKGIASSGATPFWQTLATGSTWDSPLMAFQLTRFVNQSNTQSLEAGGSFTMGFVNNSLFTGDIEYINIPSEAANSYWILPITAITVQGNSISPGTGRETFAAIDTGTTLVGGPAQEIASIYAQIPGSSLGTGQFEGYYLYPCDTSVTVALSFGGRSWTVSPADFQVQQVSRGTCLGGFFALTTGDSAPSWIVGDTFLKNVYSVFRFNPASIGFASLSDASLAMNGNVDLQAPSATIGSVSAAATAGTSGLKPNSATPLDLRASSLIFTIAATLIWVVQSNL